jgi:hypothetical protein
MEAVEGILTHAYWDSVQREAIISREQLLAKVKHRMRNRARGKFK